MDIVLLYCNWLLSKYFQCIFLLFNLKFLLSLILILDFYIKTLIVFICNCYLDIFQFWRLQAKCLIVFIIKHFVVLNCWNYLALWFLLHNLRFIPLCQHKWRLIKCLYFHYWLVLFLQNLLLKLIFLDLIWEIIICKCHCFQSILIFNVYFLCDCELFVCVLKFGFLCIMSLVHCGMVFLWSRERIFAFL